MIKMEITKLAFRIGFLKITHHLIGGFKTVVNFWEYCRNLSGLA
jgi:hypothetical protein